MDTAGLLAKLKDEPGGRMLKAFVFSLALHLALIMLIQPARQAGTTKVVLQARIVAAPTEPAPSPAGAIRAEAEQSAPPSAEAPIPTETVSAPAPMQAQATPPQQETGAATGGMAQTDADERVRSDGRDATPAGPSTGLPEIPVLLDTQWYTARQVDRRPEIMTPALPVYPEEARRRGIEGSVVIEVHIDEFGEVSRISVLEANPPGMFDAAVIDVYGKARYSPAVLNGRPVRYIGKYRVLFELD